jgi:YesN/AraC family two-component response regulator
MQKFKIAIVDDEFAAREILERLLKDISAKSQFNNIEIIFKARSSEDFFKQAKEIGNPDIAMLDICMPGTDGFKLIKKIKEKFGESVLIIMVTAYDCYAIKAIKNRVFDYLLKPLLTKELINAIKNAIQYLNEGANTKNNIEKINSDSKNNNKYLPEATDIELS